MWKIGTYSFLIKSYYYKETQLTNFILIAWLYYAYIKINSVSYNNNEYPINYTLFFGAKKWVLYLKGLIHSELIFIYSIFHSEKYAIHENYYFFCSKSKRQKIWKFFWRSNTYY